MTILEAIKHNKRVVAYDLFGRSSLWHKQNSGVISGYDLAKPLDQALKKDPLSSPSNLQEDLRWMQSLIFAKSLPKPSKCNCLTLSMDCNVQVF